MFIDKNKRVIFATPDGVPVPVRVEINPRARRLILRVDSHKQEGVVVAPTARDIPKALDFARDRTGWLAETLAQLPPTTHLEEGAAFPLRGTSCFLTAKGSGRLATLEPGPPQTLRLPGDGATLSARALRYLKRAARADLEAAVARHCTSLNVKAQRISIKDTRSRWGSCTAAGALSFSWRLICAPPSVLNYVAAHECAHLREMNHSPAFWAEVARAAPDWRAARDWLHTHGQTLQAIRG